MVDSASKKSMTRSVIGTSILLLGFGLVVLAALKWRSSGWEAMVWLLCFMAQLAIRVPFTRRVRGNAIVTENKDPAEQVAFAAMFLAMMILPLVHLASGVFGFAAYQLPAWAGGLGAAAQLPFLWLFWRSHSDLGLNWSPGLELREGHRLVTDGVYARIRHPMYAALLLSALAQPLLIQNWIAGVLAIPVAAALMIVRMPKEEAMMQDRFGADYDAYCRRTGRLLPKFGEKS